MQASDLLDVTGTRLLLGDDEHQVPQFAGVGRADWRCCAESDRERM
jgi:hypothetical protein